MIIFEFKPGLNPMAGTSTSQTEAYDLVVLGSGEGGKFLSCGPVPKKGKKAR